MKYNYKRFEDYASRVLLCNHSSTKRAKKVLFLHELDQK